MDIPRGAELNHSYDEEADVLYISFGQPRPSVGWEPQEGIVIHKAPLTGEVVGVTIINCKRHFKAHPEEITEAIRGPRLSRKASTFGS